MFKRVSVAASLLVLVACQSPTETARLQIAETSRAEKDAGSLQAWEFSEHHPAIVTGQWRMQAKESERAAAAPCEALSEVEGREILIWESEIKNDKNAALFAPCLPKLNEKINVVRTASLIEWEDLGYLNPFGDDEKKPKAEAPAPKEKAPKRKVPSRQKPVKQTVAADFGVNVPQFNTVIDERELKTGVNYFKGDMKPMQVALTFDDGPSPEVTPRVLATLKAFNAKAMFFQCGKNISKYPEWSKQVAADGHGLANHSWHHPYMGKIEACTTESCRSTWINEEQGYKEFVDTHRLLKKVVGWVNPFIRFPYGATTPTLTAWMKAAPVAMFFWNADSNDWKMSLTDEQVMNNALDGLRKAKGGIVLFHDVHARTADLLPEFLRKLHEGGFQLVLIQPKDKSLNTEHPWIKSQNEALPLRRSP